VVARRLQRRVAIYANGYIPVLFQVQDIMTDDDSAAAISKILATWGPVGEEQAAAIGLRSYDVEAQDILWAMELHGYSVKRAVSDVLQQAFLIELDQAEVVHYSNEITAVLANK
jgi:hypothetical protein